MPTSQPWSFLGTAGRSGIRGSSLEERINIPISQNPHFTYGSLAMKPSGFRNSNSLNRRDFTTGMTAGLTNGVPHGDHPFSHGIAVRPGAREVWFMDDQWGYLNIFDTSKSGFAPTFKGHVELFDEIDQPWGRDHGNRWVAFSIDGKYCYPADGLVVDAETGKKTSMRISPSEKLIEVEFRGNTAMRVSGQMGGIYGTGV